MNRAMREASGCRMATDTDSYAFFVLQLNANEGKTAAREFNMCENLRKVVFSLGNYEFHPNETPVERQAMEERIKDRNGYFHKWVEEVDNSKEIPVIKPMALVEDAESGKIHEVEINNIKFSSDWQ